MPAAFRPFCDLRRGDTGELGQKTRDAIVAFQGDHHLEMTGLIGGGLLDALGLR